MRVLWVSPSFPCDQQVSGALARHDLMFPPIVAVCTVFDAGKRAVLEATGATARFVVLDA